MARTKLSPICWATSRVNFLVSPDKVTSIFNALKIAGRLRLDLAQYRELEAFAAFGSDLDAASKAQLERGARMVELLKQGQYSPYSLERQIVSIWAGTTGKLDDVAVADIRRFEAELLDFIARERKEINAVISETKQLDDDTIAKMEEAVASFKKQFKSSASRTIPIL